MKTLDEVIFYYKTKYNLLKNYDPLRAEEYKQLADWLIDYKRLKIILNESVAKMNKIINDYKSKMEEINNEKSEENSRWNMIYDNYTKTQVDKDVNEKEINALKEGLCQ